jgi:hypothetical protein
MTSSVDRVGCKGTISTNLLGTGRQDMRSCETVKHTTTKSRHGETCLHNKCKHIHTLIKRERAGVSRVKVDRLVCSSVNTRSDDLAYI